MCTYSVPHKELCLCCDLTVCDPIKTILESFDVCFLTHLEEDKGKLSCPMLPKEKGTKITLIPLQLLQIFA